jgi:RNase H-like domain found in reverse transcriptase
VDDNGEERPIAFAARSLKPAEKNYAPMRFELLAMMWAPTEAFRTYLYGCPNKVVVFTDNKPLKFMAEQGTHPTIARWPDKLLEVNYERRHIAGKDNPSDALSHLGFTFSADEKERGERTVHVVARRQPRLAAVTPTAAPTAEVTAHQEEPTPPPAGAETVTGVLGAPEQSSASTEADAHTAEVETHAPEPVTEATGSQTAA